MTDWETLLSNARARVQDKRLSIEDRLGKMGKTVYNIAIDIKNPVIAKGIRDDLSDTLHSIKHRVHLIKSPNRSQNRTRTTYEIMVPYGATDINYLNTQFIGYKKGLNIENVTFPPNSLKTIGKATFSPFPNIKSVDLPASIEYVADEAFNQNTELHIICTKANQGTWAYYKKHITYITIDNSLKIVPEKIFCDYSALEKITIDTNIKEIKAEAFKGCENLSSIFFYNKKENSLQLIDKNAFANCTNLMKFESPQNLKEIKDCAFAQCTKIETLSFNEGLKHIGERAFEGTSIQRVSIPSSVTFIGENAFGDCKKLTEITLPIYDKDIDLHEQPLYKNIYDNFKNDYYKDFDSLNAYDKWNRWNNEKSTFDDSYLEYTRSYLGLSNDCEIKHHPLCEESETLNTPV